MKSLPNLEGLTNEQKDQLIISLFLLVQKLEKKVEELEKEVKELKNQLNKNSHNSHKPPSSDGYKKNNSEKPKSQRPSGAQRGHQGQTLRESDHPDEIIKHEVRSCPYCAFNLSDNISTRIKKAQVFDIPLLKIEVQEHQVEEKFCPGCHRFCTASLPDGIKFGVQYGTRIQALMTYLHSYQFITSQRVVEFIKDIFTHTLSEGSLFNAEKVCFRGLEHFEKKLKQALARVCVVHADETGLRVVKKNHWLHVLSTRCSSCFFIHRKRGQEAIEAMNILPHFKGIIVHDHFKPYFRYGYGHALCNAHHLRELQYIFDYTGHPWALQMQNLLKAIKKSKDQQQLTAATIKTFDVKYDEIVTLGFIQQNKRRSRFRKEFCLLKRLKNYKFQTLLFMHQEEVPFDNNQAERDIRMMKVKMKISGCFRSTTWPNIFCRIRSYISTIKKNGMAVFQSLVDVFNPPSPTFLTSIRFS